MNWKRGKDERDFMYKYKIIIYWSEEDNSYIADVPELPGCMADGKTYEDVLKNVRIVIHEWIETALNFGRNIPIYNNGAVLE